MKKICLIVMMLIMASLVAVSAAADTDIVVSYDMVKDDVCVNADVYRVDVSMLDNEGDNFKSFASYITFDSSLLIPYDGMYDEALTEDVWSYCVLPGITQMAGRPKVENIVFTPGYPVVEGTQMDIEMFDNDPTSAYALGDGEVLVSIYFVFADGKSMADLTSESFKVNQVIYLNDVQESNTALDSRITVKNNVVPAGDDEEEEVVIENKETVVEENCPVFSVNFSTIVADEYGFVGTARNENGVAEGDFTLADGDKVVSAAIVDFEADKDAKAWVTGVPAGAAIAVRAYYVFGDDVVYGEIMEFTFEG